MIGKADNLRCRRSGFSLVEATLSTVLVGVLLVATLNTVGSTRLGQQNILQRGQATMLARELMTEIMRKDYADPDDGALDLTKTLTTTVLGVELGESATNRADFDDVDDYHSWTSQPPENEDGTPLADMTDWERSVTVERVGLLDRTQLTGSEEGVKRITVTVKYQGTVQLQLYGLKGAGLPEISDVPRVLLVVRETFTILPDDTDRKNLIEGWGFPVTLIDDDDTQANFDAALASNDVAYVSETIQHSALGSKLTNASIGVACEAPESYSEMGFCVGWFTTNATSVQITDNTHYITQTFPLGTLTLFNSTQNVAQLDASQAVDLQVFGETTSPTRSTIAVLEKNATREDGGSSAERRVQMPWGQSLDVNSLTSDAKTLMKRAIEWGARKEDSGSPLTLPPPPIE